MSVGFPVTSGHCCGSMAAECYGDASHQSCLLLAAFSEDQVYGTLRWWLVAYSCLQQPPTPRLPAVVLTSDTVGLCGQETCLMETLWNL